jgi:hypothetical protein
VNCAAVAALTPDAWEFRGAVGHLSHSLLEDVAILAENQLASNHYIGIALLRTSKKKV